MRSLLRDDPRLHVVREQQVICDDFTNDIDSNEWAVVATDSGTAAVGDAAKGILPLVASDGTVADNDETYVKSPNETFLFAADKPIFFEALVQFTEANTDDANIIVGLKDAVAANTLVDDGGGPPSSYSGFNFHKVDGGTKWLFESSLGATQITNTTDVTAGGSAYQRLAVEVRPLNTTQCEIIPFIDGNQCRDNTSGLPIKHLLTYTSATEMQVCLGVKNGGANLETLNVDYVYAAQKR